MEVLAKKHDVIKIDSHSGEIFISRPILFEDEISDMTFTSYNGRPTITSLNNHDLYLLEARKNISVTFRGLGFCNIQLIRASFSVTATQRNMVSVYLHDCNLKYDTTSSNHLLSLDENEQIHFHMKTENCYVGSSSSVGILKTKMVPESFMMKVAGSSLQNVSNILVLAKAKELWVGYRYSRLFSLYIMKRVVKCQDDTTALVDFRSDFKLGIKSDDVSFGVFEIQIADCVVNNAKSLLMIRFRYDYFKTKRWKIAIENSSFVGKHGIRGENVVTLVMVRGSGDNLRRMKIAILIANCVFMNILRILKLRPFRLLTLSLIVRDSAFVEKHGIRLTNGFALIMLVQDFSDIFRMKGLIVNCTFLNTLPVFQLQGPLGLFVNIKNSTFIANHGIPVTNGVSLIMFEGVWKNIWEVLISNCMFAINFPILKRKGWIRLSVNNSSFVGNHGIQMENRLFGSKITTTDDIPIIIIEGQESKITIANCKFFNIGFVLKVKDVKKVSLFNSKFVGSNRARGRPVTAENADAIRIIGCVFRENQVDSGSMCGDRQSSGNGGALLILGNTRIVIEGSLFENNTASCYGDSIFIDCHDSIELANVSFKNSVMSGTSGGITWYSKSKSLLFSNVTFKVTDTVRQSRTIYTEKSERTIVGKLPTSFHCPNGANVNFHPRTRKSKVTKVECNFCRDKTYTLEKSYANVRNFSDSDRGIHSVICNSCPFGATCTSNIRPKTNFWGYVYNKKAHLISCPPGYCCQTTEDCRSLESCNVKRRGVLCGQCTKDYAQSVFSDKCIQDSQCNSWRFWGIMIAFCFGLLLILAYLQDILAVLFRRLDLKAMLRCFPQRANSTHSRMFTASNGLHEEQDTSSQRTPNLEGTISESGSHIPTLPLIERQEKQENTSTTSGLIKILFFYYQMNALLIIYKSEYQLFIFNQMKSFFNNLFTFNANSETLSNLGCPFPGMDIVRKRLIKASIPCMMLGLAGGILLIIAVSAKFIKNAVVSNYLASLRNRILVTALQIILLGYSSLTSNIFSLLTCISMVNWRKILFIQGNINCYQTWQLMLLSFVIVWSLPLTVALYMASIRVKENTLTIKGFFSAVMFPLPSVIYFTFKRAVRQDETSESIESQSPDDVYYPVSPTTDALEPLIQTTDQPQPQLPQQQQQPDLRAKLLHVLASSFRSIDKGGGRLQWEPVLIAQRLVLLTLHAFLTNPIIKALSMLATVFVITCINIAARPFHNILLNGLNIMYLLFLFVSGLINSLYAYIYIGETKPSGPVLDTLRVLDIIELAMQLLFPCVAAAAVIIIIITKLFHLLYYLLVNAILRCKRYVT